MLLGAGSIKVEAGTKIFKVEVENILEALKVLKMLKMVGMLKMLAMRRAKKTLVVVNELSDPVKS